MRPRLPITLALAATLLACGTDTTTPVAVARVDVTPATLTLHPGETTQLSAIPKAADGTTLPDRPVAWASGSPAIATISPAGLVTAVASGGPVTLSATSENITGTATLTVTPIPVASIELSRATASLEAGDTLRLAATPKAANGATLTGRPVAWTSADPTIATVTPAGLVTGVGAGGPVAISATSEGVQAAAQVTVVPATVRTVTITPATTTIIVGNRTTLAATLRDARGAALTGRAITWTSGNPAIASIAADGTVTGVAAGGPVTLTATSDGVQGTASVSVISVPVARVTVTAPSAELNEGTTLQLAVQLTDSAGNTLNGRTITWTSDSTHVATVDAAGLVRAVRTGTTRVRARTEGVEGSLTLTSRGLIHRWTFDEDGGAGTTFRDGIRGATGSIVQGGTLDATAIGGQVTLTGGAKGNADYVALQGRLLRSLTDATIEVWATVHSLRSWSRVLDIGSGPTNNLFMAWSQATSPVNDRTGFTVGGVETRLDNALVPFTLDLQHHIVFSIDEGGGAGGRTKVSLFLDGAPRGQFETTYRLRDLQDDEFWLGRSHYGDETANASYDEVRIHDRVYTSSDVQQLFHRGPVRGAPPASLTLVPPAGMRDTVRGVDTRFPLRLVGRDARGRQFPVSGARWASSNTGVATVDTLGSVHARTAGQATLSATVGATTVSWNATVVRMRRVAIDPYLATPAAGALWEVPVVLLEYLPSADGATIDTLRHPDFYWANPMTLDSAERRILTFAQRRKMGVEQGSRFRGYKDAAALPSLGYRVVEHLIVYDIEPASTRRDPRILGNPYFADWFRIFADLQLDPLMRSRGVREIWIAESGLDAGMPSYRPGVHNPADFRTYFESNMSSPTTGDISNSFRDPSDLPILGHTYIVYNITYRRSQAEALHNVGHQLEAMMSYVANRQDGSDRLFWRDFVGQDAQRQFITGRAGWTHMPPNTVGNYDYLNATLVPSDIEDWRPDNAGAKKSVNLNTWGSLTYPWPGAADFDQRVESQWYTYWWQNFPGRGNRIPHGADWMTNWWAFVANWDAAVTSGLGLHGPTPAAARGAGTMYPYNATAAVPPRTTLERPGAPPRAPAPRRQ